MNMIEGMSLKIDMYVQYIHDYIVMHFLACKKDDDATYI